MDHGKTSLLDFIRGSAVAAKEPGSITQSVGASLIPSDTIKNVCGNLLEKMNISVDIPGLLFLDSPGHEAFTAIRKRGSSIADLAVLVVDINEGFKAQTNESLQFLKEFKTPFVVAATKIDRIPGWVQNKECFLDSIAKQPKHAQQNLDEALYKLVGQLSDRGFDSERFDRVDDFRKNIAIVPVSNLSGEGIPDIMVVLAGLAQNYLKDKLEVEKGKGEGSILEMKEYHGLGTTIDVILYDGEIRKGDTLIVGGKEPIVTKIRALLKPKPLGEIRVEKDFENVDHVNAAAGIKISAPDLGEAVAGTPIVSLRNKENLEKELESMKKEIAELEFEKSGDGVILRADTLGSLEALIHMLKERGLEVRKAEVGKPVKRDLIEAEDVKDRYKKVIFAFNVKSNEIEQEAKDRGIQVFQSDVIYRLFENYDQWKKEEEEKERQEKIECITTPAKFVLLKGFVFRQSDPAVVGIEMLDGCLRPGVQVKKGNQVIGTVKQIQKENETVEKVDKGERAAVSIQGGIVGRNIKEGDELLVIIHENDLKIMKELEMDTKLAEESI